MHSATPSTIAHISQSQDSTVSPSGMPESCRIVPQGRRVTNVYSTPEGRRGWAMGRVGASATSTYPVLGPQAEVLRLTST